MNDFKDEKQRRNEKKRWSNRRKACPKKDVRRTSGLGDTFSDQPTERVYVGEPKECSFCGKPVTEVLSALADKTTGEPVHFDCVLNYLTEHEKLEKGQSISYIGQGRFAVMTFQAGSSQFTIARIIEWEARDKKYEWRSRLADAYSKVK